MKDSPKKSVVMVAGEASGDLHGARLIGALRERLPDIRICGAGGDAMKDAGARIVVDIRELSVMGFTAVFSKAPRILRHLGRLKRLLVESKPDLLILIDFQDFNLHLAGYAKKIGIPVLFYISPKVWAWRAGRIQKIKRRVDHMAVILPFEEVIYTRHGVPATFVGHPLMDGAPPEGEARSDLSPDISRSVALLPGSRECEVSRLLPEMLKAARILQREDPELRFEISRAPSIPIAMIDHFRKQHGVAGTRVTDEPVYAIFKRCQLAVIASGTASLEAAIYGIPTIIVYSVSNLSYLIAKLLVHVPHIGLANLIAGKRVLPELVQDQATAVQIAAVAEHLLNNPAAYHRMQTELKAIRKQLGHGGASGRVAAIACRLMECHRAV
jgi:lipid-A-disaccharide synthase